MAVQPPPQDPPADSPAAGEEEPSRTLTILGHLQELRYRAMVSAAALVIGIAVSLWPLTGIVIEFLARPGEENVENFQLIFTEPLEYWTSYFRVSLLLGFTISMPVHIYQLLAFVSPGLTWNERKWLYPIVIGATLSFLGGAAFALLFLAPMALITPFGQDGVNVRVEAHFAFQRQPQCRFGGRRLARPNQHRTQAHYGPTYPRKTHH